jgi:hypothetical protein
MTEARACTPGAANQCQVLVQTSLSVCPGCSTYVNDATKLDEIRAAWTSAGCGNVAIACPAIACVLPGPSTCAPTDSGPPGGTCTIGVLTTN